MKKLFVLLSFIFANSAYALTEGDALNKIIHELYVIQSMLKEQTEIKADTKYYFDWKALQADIEIVEQGIHDWFQRDMLEPRNISVIQGDYVGASSDK